MVEKPWQESLRIRDHLHVACGVVLAGNTLSVYQDGVYYEQELPEEMSSFSLPMPGEKEEWLEEVHWTCGLGLVPHLALMAVANPKLFNLECVSRAAQILLDSLDSSAFYEEDDDDDGYDQAPRPFMGFSAN